MFGSRSWAGPPGQYVIGTFTATATSQVVNFDLGGSGTNNEQVNGLLLSHNPVVVPEPASIAIAGLAALGPCVFSIRRRKAKRAA